MIWIILSINVLTIAVAFKKRMILYALLNAVFLFLVTGQAFQIAAELDRARTVTYLSNFISDVGFQQALWYVLILSLVSFLFALVSGGYVRRTELGTKYSFAPGMPFYVALLSCLAVTSLVLIFVVVGIQEFLHSTRPGFQPGATIFIVLLSVGIFPLLLKILCKVKPARGDVVCFLFTFVVSAGFSRIHLILYLTALLLSCFYAYGWADRPLSFWLLTKVLMFGTVVGVTFIGIGALHDAQNFVQGSVGDLINYILANPEKSLLSIEYNYRVGVEGMSGVAGAFTQSMSDPNSVHHDFGLSSILYGVVLTLPGFVKIYVGSLADLGASLNWYPFSIIPTGAESFFMSFGWAAVILYPAAIYLLGWLLPLRVLAMRTSPLSKLLANLLFACSIFFVRGSIAAWISFSISYAAVIIVSWPLFQTHFKRTEPGTPEIAGVTNQDLQV